MSHLIDSPVSVSVNPLTVVGKVGPRLPRHRVGAVGKVDSGLLLIGDDCHRGVGFSESNDHEGLNFL